MGSHSLLLHDEAPDIADSLKEALTALAATHAHRVRPLPLTNSPGAAKPALTQDSAP